MKNNITLAFFFLTSLGFSTKVFSELSVLKTKLSQEMIRYIDIEGKFTYYQKKDGALYLSSNYDVKKIIQGAPKTFYNIIEGEEHILVHEFKDFYNHLSLNHNSKISYSKIGDKKFKEIGFGMTPQLHLNDNWVSFFRPDERKIKFHLVSFPEKNFSIIVKNKYPNFSPQVVMLNEQSILYSDYDSSGQSMIYLFDKITKDFKVIYQSSQIGKKLEFCLNQDELIVGEFSLHGNHSGSSIFSISRENIYKSLKKTSLYQSKLSDLGQLFCLKNNSVSFLKTVKQINEINYFESDLYKLNTKSKKVEQLTKSGDIYSYFKMSNQLYLPGLDHYHVVGAKSDFSQDKLKIEKSKKDKKNVSP